MVNGLGIDQSWPPTRNLKSLAYFLTRLFPTVQAVDAAVPVVSVGVGDGELDLVGEALGLTAIAPCQSGPTKTTIEDASVLSLVRALELIDSPTSFAPASDLDL